MKFRHSLLIIAASLSACGGSDDGNTGAETPPPAVTPPATTPVQTNTPPVAEAGGGFTALSGAKVTILGSGTDQDGTIASYLWSQSAGPGVELAVTDEKDLSFQLPSLSEDTQFTFQLTVTDDDGDSHTDEVNIFGQKIDWQMNKSFIKDINNDGLLDIITTYTSEHEVSKLAYRTNLGNGEFATKHSLDENHEGQISAVTTGDIDGQHGDDLIVVTHSAIYSYKFTSEGRFSEKDKLTESWTIANIYSNDENEGVFLSDHVDNSNLFELIDVNGDGALDLVWNALINSEYTPTERGASSPILYQAINQGEGSFSSPVILDKEQTFEPISRYYSFHLKRPFDIDNDGVTELVTIAEYQDFASGDDQAYLRWFELGSSDYQQLNLSAEYGRYEGTMFLDWDEDGAIDIISRSYLGTTANYETYYLQLKNNSVTFQESLSAEIAPDIADVILDLDKDGMKDLIEYRVDRFEPVRATYWQRKQVSAVENPTKLFDYYGDMLGAFDLDNDGDIDFISQDGHLLSWFENLGEQSFTMNTINLME